MQGILEGLNLTKRFGGLVALQDVSFHIQEGEVLGLIGPNGAGKTTLFNVITGISHVDSGVIKFKGEKITGLPPHEVCRRGIARTFQLVKPFSNISVLENVTSGRLFGRDNTNSLKKGKEEALKFLELTDLIGKADLPAKELTPVEQKRLEMARALATNPEVLLLDEIAQGLTPREITVFIGIIERINKEIGVTIFMIEHVMRAIMNTASRIIVLNYGNKISEGTPKKVAEDPLVIKAYFGEKYSE